MYCLEPNWCVCIFHIRNIRIKLTWMRLKHVLKATNLTCLEPHWCVCLFHIRNARFKLKSIRLYHVLKDTNLTNPMMLLLHIPQCTFQNRNVHISVLNGVLWDMEQVHCRVCEICVLLCLKFKMLIHGGKNGNKIQCLFNMAELYQIRPIYISMG